MPETAAVVLAHRAEPDGSMAYEDLTAPFEAERVVLQPLCTQKLLPEKIVPQVRLSVARALKIIFAVPLVDAKLDDECTPGWLGTYPCARCVCERWSEILGGNPVFRGGVRLERLRMAENVEGDDKALLRFVQGNLPAFSFVTSSPLAVPAVRFRLSGRTAALFLGNRLFVQTRRRALRPQDVDILLGAEAPEPAKTDETLLLQDDALYDADWVARFLRIKPGTLSNWISQGKIPCSKVGGNRFLGKVLRAWLEARTRRADDEADPETPVDQFPWEKK